MTIFRPTVQRDDLLAILVSLYFSGHDKQALYAVAIACDIDKEFIGRATRMSKIIEGKRGEENDLA